MSIDRQAIPGLGVIVTTKATIADSELEQDVSAQGFSKVKILSVLANKTATAVLTDDVLNVDEATDANGLITVPADGTIAINRTGTTAALPIIVTMIGY